MSNLVSRLAVAHGGTKMHHFGQGVQLGCRGERAVVPGAVRHTKGEASAFHQFLLAEGVGSYLSSALIGGGRGVFFSPFLFSKE